MFSRINKLVNFMIVIVVLMKYLSSYIMIYGVLIELRCLWGAYYFLTLFYDTSQRV